MPLTLEEEEVHRVRKKIQLGNSQSIKVKCEKGGKDKERKGGQITCIMQFVNMLVSVDTKTKTKVKERDMYYFYVSNFHGLYLAKGKGKIHISIYGTRQFVLLSLPSCYEERNT